MSSLLVTVGSTQFPALTDYIVHPHTLSSLLALGITRITIQHGTHPLPRTRPPHPLTVHPITYTRDFSRLLSESHFVISHAGSGTVLECLACAKPLIVVVNSTLMDNHQNELATAMALSGCCRLLQDFQLDRVPTVLKALLTDSSPVTLPERQVRAFAALVAEELEHASSSAGALIQ